MFGAMKVLVPIGMGLVGLVAFSQKAKAAPLDKTPQQRNVPTPKAGSMSTDQVVKEMTAAIASADPQLLLALADKLEKSGFPDQAKDLRGVGSALQKVGATAAGTSPPPLTTKPATPVAAIPPAPPAASVSVPPPVAGVTSPGLPSLPQQPTTTLPEMVVTPGNMPSAKERALATQVVINQQSKPKWQDNRDLTTLLQTQESKAGRYKNILTGEPGKVDGLYGPGTAIGLAETYGIVPPNPKYWPTNPAPSLSKYKARLLALASADPARSTEWTQAANNAKVIK